MFKFIAIFIPIAMVYASPNGAPLAACKTLLPHHGSNKPQSGFPYELVVHSVIPPINLTIVGQKGKTFKGFLLQILDKKGQLAGSFDLDGHKDAKAIDCLNSTNSAATHNSPSVKTSVDLVWNPPKSDEIEGDGADYDYVAQGTVVEEFSKFYVKLKNFTVSMEDIDYRPFS